MAHDNEEIAAFERSTNRARRIRLAVLAILVASPILWVVYKNVEKRRRIAAAEEAYRERMRLSDAERTRLTELVSSTRKAATEAITTFKAAVTPDGLDKLEDAGTDCARRLSPGAADFRVFPTAAAVTPRAAYVIERLDEIAARVTAGKADRSDLEQAERYSRGGEPDLFVVGQRRDPIVLADSYVPGSISGFAYLYSYQAGKVICFTSLVVENAPVIDVEYTYMEGNIADDELKKREAAQTKLANDLVTKAREAISERLRATL